MPSYTFVTQCRFVLCCCMIHNFIRKTQRYDDEYDMIRVEGEEIVDNIIGLEQDEGVEMYNWRDNLAERMWSDYVQQHN